MKVELLDIHTLVAGVSVEVVVVVGTDKKLELSHILDIDNKMTTNLHGKTVISEVGP